MLELALLVVLALIYVGAGVGLAVELGRELDRDGVPRWFRLLFGLVAMAAWPTMLAAGAMGSWVRSELER